MFARSGPPRMQETGPHEPSLVGTSACTTCASRGACAPDCGRSAPDRGHPSASCKGMRGRSESSKDSKRAGSCKSKGGPGRRFAQAWGSWTHAGDRELETRILLKGLHSTGPWARRSCLPLLRYTPARWSRLRPHGLTSVADPGPSARVTSAGAAGHGPCHRSNCGSTGGCPSSPGALWSGAGTGPRDSRADRGRAVPIGSRCSGRRGRAPTGPPWTATSLAPPAGSRAAVP